MKSMLGATIQKYTETFIFNSISVSVKKQNSKMKVLCKFNLLSVPGGMVVIKLRQYNGSIYFFSMFLIIHIYHDNKVKLTK